jgi:hypothetical protein
MVSLKNINQYKSRRVYEKIVMMNGDVTTCSYVIDVVLKVESVQFELECLVATIVPGMNMLLGMDVISLLGRMRIGRNGVKFGSCNICAL